MKLECCERCQFYWTCELKWYRGEQDEKHVCCEKCDYFGECSKKIKPKNS